MLWKKREIKVFTKFGIALSIDEFEDLKKRFGRIERSCKYRGQTLMFYDQGQPGDAINQQIISESVQGNREQENARKALLPSTSRIDCRTQEETFPL
jgi:hypothetical protein